MAASDQGSQPAKIRVQRERMDGEQRQGGTGSEGGAGTQEQSGGRATSAWEWVIAAIGAVLVLGAVTFMLYEALSEPNTSPRIEVSVDTIIETQYGHLVEFRARNHGQQTAAGVLIEGELKGATGTVEKAQVTIDYVPAGSRRKGGLLFTHDPTRYTLDVRAKAYDRP